MHIFIMTTYLYFQCGASRNGQKLFIPKCAIFLRRKWATLDLFAQIANPNNASNQWIIKSKYKSIKKLDYGC